MEVLQNELPGYSTGPLCLHPFSYPNGALANFTVVCFCQGMIAIQIEQEGEKGCVKKKETAGRSTEENASKRNHERHNYLKLRLLDGIVIKDRSSSNLLKPEVPTWGAGRGQKII